METFLNEYHSFTECVVLRGTIDVSQDLTSDTKKKNKEDNTINCNIKS